MGVQSNTQNESKKRKSQAPRRLSAVDLDDIRQRLLIVLCREAKRLMDESWEKKLSDESSKSLVNYLKLLKQFEEHELALLDQLDDEELEQRAQINKKNGDA